MDGDQQGLSSMSAPIEQVKIPSEGLLCAGTLFRPSAQRPGSKVPAVLLSHGFACVRTMRNVPDVANALADAGIAALTLDYRFLGESAGEPRQTVSPFHQRQDLHNALTWLSEHAEIDRERLGIWGTSYSGGHVLQVAAFDRRVKAVVSQVPATDLFRQIRQAPAVHRARLEELIAADRIARFRGLTARTMKLAAPEGEPSVFGKHSLPWIARNASEHPTFRNEVTIASLEEFVQFDPVDYIEAISPTPLLFIMASQDRLVSPDFIRQAYERAGQPKKLLTVEGSHYDVYDEPAALRQACEAARDWFVQHLS
jgi:fermentation-respiration switch protein FrsA (DUF1100 family)